MTARTLAPSLAAGNCAVLKPAEDTPLTALAIARLALEAGFEPGMVNVVNGFGHEAGAALSAHPGVGHLSFTGSRPVGTLIAKAAADNVVPVVLELAAEPQPRLRRRRPRPRGAEDRHRDHQNAGQTCSAGSRVLVHRSIHDELVRRVAEAFEAMRIGPAMGDPDLGAIINAKQRDQIHEKVAAATSGGPPGHRRRDPHRRRPRPWLLLPATLFDQVDPASPIGQQEAFGPVLAVTAFDTDDERSRSRTARSTGWSPRSGPAT